MTKTDYAMTLLGLFILGYVVFVATVAPATFRCAASIPSWSPQCDAAAMANEVKSVMQILAARNLI